MKYNLTKNLIIGLVCLLQIGKAQTDNANHRKYWYYKSRLNNDFLKVGLNSGESMPAQQRGADRFPKSFTGDVNSYMKWGDASSYLGYYIGILASEYYLLQQNGQSTATVKHELFCALNAVNRLDYVAETYFNGPATLNGFFVRDDVPANFVTSNYKHFNYYDNGADGLTSTTNGGQGFMSKFDHGANLVKSDKIDWDIWASNHYIFTDKNDASAPYIEMSQDQAYAILLGLTMVKKFVPNNETDNGATFGYGSGQTSLAAEAQNIAGRIIGFIKTSSNVNGSSCIGNFAQPWKIKNPLSCFPVSWNKDENGIGDDVGWSSYALAETGCMINTNGWGAVQASALTFYPKLCGASGYFGSFHNAYSQTTGVLLWDLIAPSLMPGNGDNRLHAVNLQAMCNCVYGTIADHTVNTIVTELKKSPLTNWLGVFIGWVWNLVSSIVSTFVPGTYINNTSTSINVNAYSSSANTDFDHAPLARKVLHGGFYYQNNKYTIKYLLDAMPCDDEYYLPNESTPYGHAEWSATDRIEHSGQRKGGLGSGEGSISGEYPALDYLLYHNLWYILQQQQGNNPAIEDLSNIYVNKNGGFAPSNTIYRGYETITTENTKFNPTNNLGYMRAGKIIDFLPGTEIVNGSNLHAYIQKFDCATDNGTYRLAGGDSTQNVQEVLDTQPHYINYPKDELAVSNAQPDSHFNNMVTELAPDANDIIEVAMQNAYPNYSKQLFVKPTVTSDNVKAYFTMDNDEYAFINILSLDGKNLYSNNYLGKERSGITIDFTAYPAGTYLLKFTTTKGTSKTQKIIKQ